nr:hypothetical protein HK105_007548 [Polyrhizophydium stewartii]
MATVVSVRPEPRPSGPTTGAADAAHASGTTLVRADAGSAAPLASSTTSDGSDGSRQPLLQRQWLRLRPGFTNGHLAAFFVGSLFTISFFVFVNSSQAFVLKEIVHTPDSELGNTSGSLVFWDQITTLVVITIWGALSDSIGRHAVYAAGYLLIGAAFLVYPYATNAFPQLLLLRILFACGGAAVSAMIAAVMADVADERDRGKIAGIAGFMTGLGALMGLFVFLRLPTVFGKTDSGLRRSYSIDPFASVAGSPSTSFGDVRNAKTNWLVAHFVRTVKSARDGLAAARDPRIALGYVGSFLARGDTIAVSLFIPLWVYKYYLDNGLCESPEGVNGDIQSCREAYVLSSIISGVTQTFALIGAPLFGFLADKLYRPLVLLIASVMAMVGYFLLFLSTDPHSKMNYFTAFLVGVGEIGMVTLSLTFVTASSVPREARGGVAGVSSLFGAVGILIITKLGGYLFDSWSSGAPFFVVSVMHILCIGATIVVMIIDFVRLGFDGRRSWSAALGRLRTHEQNDLAADS